MTDKAFLKHTEGLVKQTSVPIDVKVIAAGKFRRYADIALWKQVLRPDIGGQNLVDMFKIAGGVAQSIRLLKRVKPDVVFAKGGYVSMPVGYAAHLLRIPLVIHDSDVRPGLTNRVLSRWAQAIATGMPIANYRYNKEITVYTGVPVGSEFHPYTETERKNAKKTLEVDPVKPLIAVTGGSLGAKDINQALVAVAPELLKKGYSVYHVSGKLAFHDMQRVVPKDVAYQLVPFMYHGLPTLYGAADVVVTRASATTLQELAAAARPAIIVPNSSLGDQLENAETYEKEKAAVVLRDEALFENPASLRIAIEDILADKGRAERLADRISRFSKPDAAETVAKMIMKAKKTKRGRGGAV